MTDRTEILAVLAKLQAEVRMDGRHRYWRGKESLPAVTSIIRNLHKEALIGWAAKVQQAADLEAFRAADLGEDLKSILASVAHAWRRERDTAGDIGKEVHALIEAECKRRLGLEHEAHHVSDEARQLYQGWEEWAERSGLEVVAVEQRIWHDAVGYAGTLDLLCYLHNRSGHLCVADWKSANTETLYPEHELQSVAYRRALMSHGMPGPIDGLVLKFPKKGPDFSIKSHDVEDSPATWTAFKGLLDVYNWLKVRK